MTEDARRGSSRIFISYRREDSIAHVNALFHPLRDRFGADRVFKDTDNIAPGQDFTKVIQSQLKTCSVLLAVIGKHWLTAQKPRSGTRRIDDPNDYLRIEVVTALKDDSVLVIPILVGEAPMPAPEDLPEELAPLSRRNGFELRDSRWESDVRLLIQAIEKACGESRMPAPREETEDTEEVPPSERTGGLQRLAARRQQQIAEHLRAARQALADHQYEEALEACEKALWLEPDAREAHELRHQAKAALDERKIGGWLAEARRLMSGKELRDADLTAASELIDQALTVEPEHAAANRLRDDVLARRRRRERDRDNARHVRAVLKRAQENLDQEDFDACIAECDDALGISPESSEARAIRERAVTARDERRRLRERRQRAEKAEAAVPRPVGSAVAAAARDSQPEVQRGSSRMLLVAGGAAAVVLIVGFVALSWLGSSESDQPTSMTQPTAPVTRPAATPAPSDAGTTAQQSASKTTPDSGMPSAPPATARPEEPVAAPPIASAGAAGNKAARPASPVETEARTLATTGPSPVERALGQPRPGDTGPATKKADIPTFAPNVLSQPAATPAAAPADTSPATEAKKAELVSKIAQLLAQDARDKGGKPASAPVAVGGAVKEPTRTKYVPPVYPPLALAANVSGTVILEATIGEDGRVRDVKVLRSVQLLDQAAIDAVKQWEYTPTYLNGAAISVTMAVSITFSL